MYDGDTQRRDDAARAVHSVAKFLVCCAAGLVVCLGAAFVSAQDASNALVLPFDGPQPRGMDAAVERVLQKASYAIVDPKPEGDWSSDQERAALLKKHAVDVLIEGKTSRKGRFWTARVHVYTGADGTKVASERFQGKSRAALLKALESTLWSKLREPIERAAKTSRDARPREVELARPALTGIPELPEKTEKPRPPSASQPSEPAEATAFPVRFHVGAKVFNRDLSYTDDLFNELRPYSLGAAPAVALALEWLPTAHANPNSAFHAGLTGSMTLALGLESATEDGDSFPTQAYEASLGAVALYASQTFQAGVRVGYRTQVFALDTSTSDLNAGPAPLIPDVSYDSIETGATARFALTEALLLHTDISYLLVLDLGGLQGEAFFPNASAQGLHADLGASYAFTPRFGLDLSLGVDRYGLVFDPSPGDIRVAGGGIDQFIHGTLSAVVRVP